MTIDRRALAHHCFGDTPELADELIALVLSGAKTATCNAVALAERDNCVPRVGELWVAKDGADRPRCVLETVSFERKPFGKVDAQFAREEGEGDLSLAFWRAAHEEYFTRNGVFAPDMDVYCERFRLVELISIEEAA